MSENELRQALQEYAAPAVPPADGRDRILQRVERRRRIPVAVLAAAVVAAVIGVGLAVLPRSSGPTDEPAAAYSARACPADVTRVPVGKLPTKGIVSARYCSQAAPAATWHPEVVDPEALVTHLPGFAGKVRAAEEPPQPRCGPRRSDPLDALVVTLSSGGQVRLAAFSCRIVKGRGPTSVQEPWVTLFADALDRQREEQAYTRKVGGRLDCNDVGVLQGPVRPGREEFVAAAACNVALSPKQLGRLQDAWSRAREVRADRNDEYACMRTGKPASLVVRSSRGDLVALSQSRCGFLYLPSHRSGRFWRLPISLANLGGAPTSRPYDAPPCPEKSQQVEATDLTGTGGVHAIRLCVVPFTSGIEPPTIQGPEALVVDLDEFLASLKDLPAYGDERCAAADYFGQDSLMLFLDGRSVRLPASWCQATTVAGRQVDGGDIRQAFLDALDRQRDTLRYESGDMSAPDCTVVGGVPGPARPGRERLVAAVLCPDYNDKTTKPRQLAPEELERLDKAWAKAVEAEWKPDEDTDDCLDLDDEHAHVLARTNRGDVLALRPSPCGFLFTDRDPGGHWRIPIAVEDLG